MGQITLVRHGQANSKARTEEEYDRLSELGALQARRLGDYLRQTGESFDLVLRGTLNRHDATAREMGEMGAAVEVDARLNEMDYLTLGRALQDKKGIAQPGPDAFMDHFIQVLTAWKQAEINGQETYESFETRIAGVLDAATQPGRRVLCVTSGGVIAMMIRHLLRLDLPAMARVALPIYNTSLHRIDVTPRGAVLSGYNSIPHLADPAHVDLRSYY
ncbi:MAG: histidine phosphatase family protein [Rhodobacterales bacterium]|nr:MAG: histidine phosphatase family protein [Rhodobacterales bacterium]